MAEAIPDFEKTNANELSRMYIVTHEGYKIYDQKLCQATDIEKRKMYAKICDAAHNLMNILLERIQELNEQGDYEFPQDEQTDKAA